MALNPGQLLHNGRYRINALLGQGGMGAVYHATDLTFHSSVAIKENLQVTPEAHKQFSREAHLLHQLRHPNLPRVTDYFFIPDQGQYLVMDYVDGEDLGQVLARVGPLPEAQAVAWISQVLDALEYLHGQGVIHRDVKPANVKITPRGQVFLVDFGLAKVYDALLPTTTGARGVTPGYASPEQYGGARTDARSDIYSVGATLYTLLTGQRPADAWEIASGHAGPIRPGQVNPAVSAVVGGAIGRAMQMRVDDRFQSAAEFRAALTSPPTVLRPARQAAPAAAATPQVRPPAVPVRSRPVSARPAWLWLAVIAPIAALVAILALTGGRHGGQTATPTGAVAAATTAATLPAATPTSLPTLTLEPTALPTLAPTLTPEPTAVPTLLPAPTTNLGSDTGPSITQVRFCRKGDFDSNTVYCDTAQDLFSGRLAIVYASWVCNGLENGTPMLRKWYWNGQPIHSNSERWTGQSQAQNTRDYTYLNASGIAKLGYPTYFPPGTFAVEFYLAGELVQRSEFVVEP